MRYHERVISKFFRADVSIHMDFKMRVTGFLAFFMRSWFSVIFPRRGCALYIKQIYMNFKMCVSSIIHEELIFRNISEKGVCIIHKAKIYTSF